MATEASNVKIEPQSNNNNDNDLADSTKLIKDEKPVPDTNEPSSNQNTTDNIKSDQAQDSTNDDNELEHDDDDRGEGDAEGENGMDHDGGNDESMDETEKTNLIVNYLPQNMTDEEFKELFTKFGAMKSCKIVRNRGNGHSYGFGFADFETHDQALKAIEELNGHELEKKKIKVAFARPAGQDIKQANLYVKNIPQNWSQEDVRKAFESFGNIIQVRVLGDKRVAFVLYDLRKQAEIALESMQGKEIEGSDEPLEIKFAADKKNDNKRANRRGGRGSGGGDNNGGGRNRERGNRGGANRNNRNRSHSDSRNRSQSRGNRSQSSQRVGFGNRYNNGNSNNHNNNNNFGPIRQQQNNRMLRFTPFAPVQQQPQQMPPQAAHMAAAYGYPSQQQQMYSVGMLPQQQQQMMQMNLAAQPMSAAMPPMTAYQMPAQLAPIGYGAASAGPAAQTMSQMYNMASTTLQDAAQMQPQLGQPMNQSRGANSNNSGNSNSNDGVTLFVYNIGPQSDEAELRSMFAPYGHVLRCNVVRKTPGGETKGFGFVTLKDRTQANAAISNLNGSPRNGKTLQVSFKK